MSESTTSDAPLELGFRWWTFSGWAHLIGNTLLILANARDLGGLTFILLVANIALGIWILKYSRIAFTIATVLTINPIFWIINGIYLRNRWSHPVVLENQEKNKTDEMEVKHLESAEQRHASGPGQAGMEVHSFNHQEGDVAPSESSDEALWVAAMSEVDSESRRAGLWAKSFGESHGVEAAAKANYMVTRVAEMKSEIQSALRTAQQLRHQQLTESRIAQMNEEQKAYERLPKGKCPSCEQIIPLTSKECPKCQASFGEGATWRVKPLV